MIINQEFGQDWAYYNADCVLGMQELPANIADFQVYSPPFSTLYIYSDSLADMGNTADDDEFFASYDFALAELYRTLKPGKYHAIHCKDLPAYMNSSGYFGLKDFPGRIVRHAQKAGFAFQRWVTVWKDPVIEMQRTKNHGLLWKNFSQRAEVTRQGMADFVLIFQKPEEGSELEIDDTEPMPDVPVGVVARARQLWSNEREHCVYDKREVNGNPIKFAFFNEPLATYTDDFISHLEQQVSAGRSVVIRVKMLPLLDGTGYFDMAGEVIARFEQFDFRFRSRVALTDDTWLIVFTRWHPDIPDKQVTNKPSVNSKKTGKTRENYNPFRAEFYEVELYESANGHWYIGNNPPQYWDSDRDYSIQCWQKYASPVWFDIDGLPIGSDDCWFDINQTNVLNARIARDNEDEKHICPLQLDLIEKLILEYTQPGEIVQSPFGGIGSEGYQAVRLHRKAILFELKSSYWQQGVKYLQEAELMNNQLVLPVVAAV